jgi:ABC-type dipeptide/oligopeptide/nickel transport system ATPase subunit
MISREDLDYLNQLQHSRSEARILRDKGLEAIVAFNLKDDHWEQEISDNEKVLFRRAKHLAWNLGKIDEYDCDNEAQYYPSKPSQPDESRVNYPAWPLIALPVLRESDLKNPQALLKKLKSSRVHPPLSKYLRAHLKNSTSKILRDYMYGSRKRLPLRTFLSELNKVLRDQSFQKYALTSGVKLRPETRALLSQEPKGANLLRLNRMLLRDAYPDEIERESPSLELFDMPGEPAPILFAANYLRTKLGNLDGYLDQSTLGCYYRVVRELFNLHNTNWALGAARPGEDSGKPSVFVTMECARAIGYFARLMENTAQFLTRIKETKEYVQHVKKALQNSEPDVPALLPSWCESELEWCLASVKTTIEAFRDYVAILLPDLKQVSDLDQIISLVENSVKDFARQSEESFRIVIEWSNLLREREGGSFKAWRKRQRNPKQRPSRRQLPEPDLTETAHLVAWGALVAARQDFKKLNKPNDQLLTDASVVFGSLSKWLRTHLDPSKEYFERTLHRCIVENARGERPTTVQDLAFSAVSLGLITKDWERQDCLQAIEILCENLDEGGHFPGGVPFVYNVKGEGRIVINAQVVRAFAQLAQHMAPTVSSELAGRIPTVVSRMIDYFKSHAIELEKGIAWPSLRSMNRERSSLWISAISVLALHRIVLMLDAHINHGVKKHFNTKTAVELKREGVPYLHELMCSDVGYVSLRDKSLKSPNRVVLELEGMRAHLVGTGRARKSLRAKEELGDLPIRSLILYGPPGTGKTTLVKSLAVTSNVDLVEVMSHDLYKPGTEKVMEQTSFVMDALKLLTSAVILFDEFEPILHPRPEIAKSITEMLTGNMLPKLDALYKAAGQNGIAYVLSTNYVERLEPAAIRAGRFDRITFIYYPDAASRACRLVSEYRHLLNRLKKAEITMPDTFKDAPLRLMKIVGMTGQRYINHLCRTGWMVAPREIKSAPDNKKHLASQTEDALRPVWRYVIWDEPSSEIDWEFFAAAEKMIDSTQNSKKRTKKTEDETRIVKMVQDWDYELRTLILNHHDANWAKILQILGEPIKTD